jgi:hypothetical protein
MASIIRMGTTAAMPLRYPMMSLVSHRGFSTRREDLVPTLKARLVDQERRLVRGFDSEIGETCCELGLVLLSEQRYGDAQDYFERARKIFEGVISERVYRGPSRRDRDYDNLMRSWSYLANTSCHMEIMRLWQGTQVDGMKKH